MNTEGIKIRYGDVAPEAKENFVPAATDKESFVDLSELQRYNLKFENYGNPCEKGTVLLDGKSMPFPENPDSENMGLWSAQHSGTDGTFETPIVLTLTTADYGQYSSQGFTLTFDTDNNIFCTSLNIKWYRYSEEDSQYHLIQDEDGNDCSVDFTPDSAFFFCRKQVSNYNRVVMTFYKLNMPGCRLRLRVIDFGYGTFFYGDELRNVSLIQELNPAAIELPANSVDFVLDSKTDMEYSFQSKQPLSIYFNNVLRATTFVTSSRRTSKTTWQIESEDYLGQLSKMTFMGDMYENQNAKALLESIFNQAGVPFSISADLNNKTLTGHIPVCDCREAIRQICFAIGAVCDTANSDKVNIRTLSGDVTQTIPLSRIRQGQSFDDSDRITAVSLTAHRYKKTTEVVEILKQEEIGVGENILIKFSEPLHDVKIAYGTIVKSSANYALINSTSTYCNMSGKKYEDTATVYTKKNPIVLASDIENEINISDAGLINSENAETVLAHAFDYLVKSHTTNLKIIESFSEIRWGDHKWGDFQWGGKVFDSIIEPGDVITAETEYLGNITGRIISQRYNGNGRILVKDCELV